MPSKRRLPGRLKLCLFRHRSLQYSLPNGPKTAVASDDVLNASSPPAQPKSKKAKRAPQKATTSGKALPRIKWTNDMASKLLNLRFEEGEVCRKIDTADTNIKVYVGKVDTFLRFLARARLSAATAIATASLALTTAKTAVAVVSILVIGQWRNWF
ncbi:hypothetical protein JG688_00018168 [Phytophthora aleatoria]|uniref:Uncharacterized protein n=1 Tax=Phytophthora aleatoria TaxID=2496075 RepID=A0A8J5IWF9_9STRA|nr:hypothetical protein JG688_00018168 [Phytophthora aleatoria]